MDTSVSHDLPTRVASAATVLVLLCTGWLSGCAQQTKVTSERQDTGRPQQAFTRVLVVGVSPSVNARCAFEHFMVSQMQSAATTVIASCDAVAQPNPLTRESIDGAVASQQADAVVATLLVSRSVKEEQGGGRDTRGNASYKATDSGFATGYYGVYGVPVIYGEFQSYAPITTAQGEVHVTSKVYETHGPTLVYTADTVAKDLESSDTGFSKVAAAIADRLRRDGLIK
jgi:hypothetical protein